MNIEEYISSGILEAYVLGELSDAERAQVEKNLALYPALREELAQIEATQELFLMQAAITPRAAVKSAIMDTIHTAPASSDTLVIQLQRWRYMAAASVALFLVSSFLAFTYWSRWKSSEENLTELIAQNQRIAQDYNQVNNRLDKIESDLKIKNNPDFKRVVLKGTDNAPDAIAYVYFNPGTQEVYLDIANMRKLAEENQYQLWAIVDGKPVDAGVFDLASGLLKMKDMGANAAAFAVTVEPRGGKPSPSLETLQVIGNI